MLSMEGRKAKKTAEAHQDKSEIAVAAELASQPQNLPLLTALKELVLELAGDSTKTRSVFTTHQLNLMTVARPLTLNEFRQCEGVTQAKVKTFGTRFIHLIRKHTPNGKREISIPLVSPHFGASDELDDFEFASRRTSSSTATKPRS